MTLDDLLAGLFGGAQTPWAQEAHRRMRTGDMGLAGIDAAVEERAARPVRRTPPAMASEAATSPAPAQAAAPAPQSRPAAGLPEPSFSDRLGAFSRGYGEGGLIGAIASMGEPDRQAEARNQTFAWLTKRGLDPDTARLVMGNKEALQAVLTRTLAPTNDAPKVETFKRPDGTEVSMAWDRKAGKWAPVDIPGGAPAPGAGGATADAPPQIPGSPVMTPQPPPGVNPQKFRDKAGEETAKELRIIQEKGLGAIDFLKRSERAKQQIKAAGDDSFGPVQGSETWNTYVRTPIASLPGLNWMSGTEGNTAADNTQKFSELNAMYKDLSSSFLKARFGSSNLSDADRKAAEDMVGGLRSADAKSGETIIANLEREGFDTLQRAVQAGTVDPRQIEPEIIERGIQARVLDPRLFGRAGASPAAAVDAGRNAPPKGVDDVAAIPDGVRFRDRQTGKVYLKRNGQVVEVQ